METIQVTRENYMTVALFLLFQELDKRDKYDEWHSGKYHPAEDPTYPKELLATPTFESVRAYLDSKKVLQ